MIIVKVSTEIKDPFLRQTPGGKGIWKNCQFILNEGIEECDYWVVYENLSEKETTLCSRKNTILVTGEPPSIEVYKKTFTNQFEHILTSQKNITGKKILLTQTALPWHIGRHYWIKETPQFSKTYDELSMMPVIKKTKLVSVISSAKMKTEGHRNRLTFVKKLKDFFGSDIDVFGAGLNPIEDKWDALAEYKYHIAIENCAIENYWTEKLADCYLAQTYPIYYGCTNLKDYFPSEAYTQFDLNDFDKSLEIIKAVINGNYYEKNLKYILQARELVLNKYNFFPLLTDYINSHPNTGEKTKITLKPHMRKKKGKLRKIITSMIHKVVVQTKKIMGTLPGDEPS